jgi:hypothetical protein
VRHAYTSPREAGTPDGPRRRYRPWAYRALVPFGAARSPNGGGRPGEQGAASSQAAASTPASPSPDHILDAAQWLRTIARGITGDEFIRQDARYSRDSRYGRELLFLMAYNGWIRGTTENVNISRSDAVDTSITMELDLGQITHEAFHHQGGDIWLPLLVLPVQRPVPNPDSDSDSGRARSAAVSGRRTPVSALFRRAGRPRSAEEARTIMARPDRIGLPALLELLGLHWRPRRVHRPDPDPFTSLTVTDAAGDLLPIVPQADVRHWIAAAMAEIIVNMAVARWVGKPGKPGKSGKRPTATRDQRLILSAAIYRLLRPEAWEVPPGSAGQAAPSRYRPGRYRPDRSGPDQPRPGRLGHAQAELDALLGAYIDDYRREPGDQPPDRAATESSEEPDRSFGHLLTQRAVQILEALALSAIVVVPVDRARTPTLVTASLPPRRLYHYPVWGMAPPCAELLIDLLLPSLDADRQVRVGLPDGVSLEVPATSSSADLIIEVEPPPPLSDLQELMSRLAGPDSGTMPTATRQCLADLAMVKAGATLETLGHYQLCPAAADADRATSRAGVRLRRLRRGLLRLSDAGGDAAPGALTALGRTWKDGSWLAHPLRRRTAPDPLGPRLAVGRATFIEELSQRGTARRGRIAVRVEITDAEYFAVARFAGTVSIILMLVVLGFLLIAQIWHKDLSGTGPSPEVLASVLTLFSAIQAGRIERLDRSTLRGMISSGATWLVVASILPTFMLAVFLAFRASGWIPIGVAAGAILLQLGLQVVMWGRPLLARMLSGRRRRQWLWTSPPPDYTRWGVLQSHWWRNTTADALKLGRQAEGYIVWEHEGTPSLTDLLVVQARQTVPPTPVPGAARRLLYRIRDPLMESYTSRVAAAGQAAQPGNSLADEMPDAPPPNLLALLRSGTANQALTFVVFREEPDPKWAEGLDVRPVALAPDRLAPMENAADEVDVFVSVPPKPDWPVIAQHPIMAVLKAARGQRLMVLEASLPVPPPAGADRDRIWARVRVGLRDGEIWRLPTFLDELQERMSDRKYGPCHAWVRTLPDGGLRVVATPAPAAGTGRARPVLASDIDVIARVTGPRPAEPPVRDWRVLALCADARAGIEADILRWMGRCWPGMRLAALSYAVLHGTAVLLLLAHQPDGSTGRKHDLNRLSRHYADANVQVLWNEWQSPQQLGLAPDEPLLGVHIDAPDQPGLLLDTLRSLQETLQATLPATQQGAPAGQPDMKNSAWYALTRVTAWSTARLTIRLPTAAEEVRRWDRAKFEEIERLTRQRAIHAAGLRRAASLTGDPLGAPEDTVISVSLIRGPDHEPPPG